MRRSACALSLAWLLLACAGSSRPEATSGQAADQAVVLVALDGFHPSYLERASSRHLRRLAQGGVRARWLVPVFPTLTFPNFYSIATGLYPEHHGIVSNTMKDPLLGDFALGDLKAVRDPRWWGGEPIWVTAVRQGKRAAAFFWPGSDVPIQGVRPTYYRLYDPSVPNADRVRQVLQWLSLPGERAPALVTLYLGDVDKVGHDFGPDAAETDSAIARVDSAVGALMTGIEQRGLSWRVNLVIVSDHGMARLERRQEIYVDDLIDTALVEIIDRGPFLSLLPRPGVEEEIYRQLGQAHPHLKVYRKSEIPAAYHYRDHHRIPSIIVVPDDGWTVTTRSYVASRGSQWSRGGHGYPPERPSMRAIFLAQGPAFEKGAVVEPFQNIHLYALLAHVLGLRPAQNDGTLDSVKAVLAQPAAETALGRSTVNTLLLEAWLMNDQTVTLLLRLIHILAGIFWVGVAFLMAGFLIPTVRETGQAGGRFMEHLMLRRRLPVFLGIAMLLTVLSGFAMYGRLIAATNGAWAGTRPGMAYGVGGLAAVLGAVLGMGIGGAAGRRMAMVSRRIAEAGGPPSAEHQSEIERLRGRMSLGARLAAGLLFISAAAMAIARYL